LVDANAEDLLLQIVAQPSQFDGIMPIALEFKLFIPIFFAKVTVVLTDWQIWVTPFRVLFG